MPGHVAPNLKPHPGAQAALQLGAQAMALCLLLAFVWKVRVISAVDGAGPGWQAPVRRHCRQHACTVCLFVSAAAHQQDASAAQLRALHSKVLQALQRLLFGFHPLILRENNNDGKSQREETGLARIVYAVGQQPS